MDPAIIKGLNDKFYEKRKASALDLEKLVRDCYNQRDDARIRTIIDQLVDLFATPATSLHARNGGLIGLAAASIALGLQISPFMERFIDPLLRCFTDPESRVRYFACESLYNIAKVSKGEILVYFNPIFDALSKLAADVELSVKHGAELLDRLLKDIVAESAPIHFPQFIETERARQKYHDGPSVDLMLPDHEKGNEEANQHRAFSLPHFIPLLAERIHVISPFTRSYLVSWITVLDSVPDLELISFLPEFLDGLFKYLSDPTEDVRVATENLMADFLREIRDISILNMRRELKKAENMKATQVRRQAMNDDALPDITIEYPEKGVFMPDGVDDASSFVDNDSIHLSQAAFDEHDLGVWSRGQDVKVDHAAIVEILLAQLDSSHDEIQQSTALRWIADFLDYAQDVMVPFTPRLIPAILPNLAHHVVAIQKAAVDTNRSLFRVIEDSPSPPSTPPPPPAQQLQGHPTGSSTTSAKVSTYSPPASDTQPLPPFLRVTNTGSTTSERSGDVQPASSTRSQLPVMKGRPPNPSSASTLDSADQPLPPSRPQSPTLLGLSLRGAPTGGGPTTSTTSANSQRSDAPSVVATAVNALQGPNATGQSAVALEGQGPGAGDASASPFPSQLVEEPESDPFDYQATVSGIMVQFLSEYVETRVAALKWLLMLHQKAPKKILAVDGEDGTFPVLLKTLSDPSDEVIKYDLQLLAQISSSSEEMYFRAFMLNLLQLFSTDRRLLETRGSLIIRQLCLTLNTERIFRTFAEILEKEEDLEFASFMVQRLNVILATSPELLDFRKRLRNIDSRDGQALFIALYRSWCHNPVAVFSLCLLAQAYEHASNLLPIIADLEITVQLLVQIDKLVQLIESPVFTSLRLQLLEPEKNQYLFKCLYGLLMLLPQSSAFISLRNRLGAVSSLGMLQTQTTARSTTSPAASAIRSKLRDEGIKWQDLLAHFRTVQNKHEKARRGEAALAMLGPAANVGLASPSLLASAGPFNANQGAGPTSRPGMRRKATTDGSTRTGGTNTSAGAISALSPLNPRARIGGASAASIAPINGNSAAGPRPASPNALKQPRKTLGPASGRR
ncbi:ARM repeat-containing protein [Clavulina sp. PMI_390]|nr:ARM repeat-containing protein [Clavulina sp. PMI_390]